MPTKKKVTPVRRIPQKAVALSQSGRGVWDQIKTTLEDDLDMALTNDQVMYQILQILQVLQRAGG